VKLQGGESVSHTRHYSTGKFFHSTSGETVVRAVVVLEVMGHAAKQKGG